MSTATKTGATDRTDVVQDWRLNESAPEAPDLLGQNLNGAPPTTARRERPPLSVVDPLRPRSAALLAVRRPAVDSDGDATFRLKQEWIGRVEEVGDESFRASLTTRDRPGEEEEAEIWLDEVSPADVGLVRPGAVFYWVVGYRDEAYGQRRSVSALRFRRLLPLSDRDRARARTAAEDLWSWVGTS